MRLQKLYYANSLRNLIMKICAYFHQIPNFGYNARSVSVILEYSNLCPSVFTPIHILFKVLQKFWRKTYFRYTLLYMLTRLFSKIERKIKKADRK